jgi:hypothetical protein
MINEKTKKTNVYNCEKCDFITHKKTDYNRHLHTAKHQMVTDGNTMVTKTLICVCGKSYKHLSGLSRHKKECHLLNCDVNSVSHDEDLTDVPNTTTTQITDIPNTTTTQMVDLSLVIELLKQNQEFKELMIEQSKQLAEQQHQNQMLLEQQQHQNTQLLEAVKDGKLANNTTNNTNNTNNNCNNKFNLNFFLNETCKDAITLDDFIKSFQVTRDEFIHTGNVGFIEGISTVMLNRFRDMDMHTRPLHCTDLKRETVYIKNADKWEKEDNNKTHLRKAVKGVANQNMKELWRWYNDSKPEVEQIGSDECENYFKYYKAALGGCGKEEDLKFEDKIIKNVLKEVHVDKMSLTM